MHPWLTDGIPGIGGIIKEAPEDFLVEEIPAYLPSGSGEHCYVTLEKRGISTLEAIHRIARQLKIAERDIGYAGMKDAVGVTRQTISIQRLDPERALRLELDGIKVIAAQRHTNKLKLGHLKGNRFRVVIRDVAADAASCVPSVLDVIGTRGVPNYFGFQRYGVQGNSHLIGIAMLQQEWQGCVDTLIGDPTAVQDEQWREAIRAYHRGEPGEALRLFPRHCRSERDVLQRLVSRADGYEKAFAAVHPRLRKLYLSAAQSFLFDQVVARRIQRLDEVVTGDLACKHVNGACFLVEDAAREQERAKDFEISPSGPLFGSNMKRPEGSVRELECEVVEQAGLTTALFDRSSDQRLEGARRPLRVPVEGMVWHIDGNSVELEFSLPKGSYATAVLRELMKNY